MIGIRLGKKVYTSCRNVRLSLPHVNGGLILSLIVVPSLTRFLVSTRVIAIGVSPVTSSSAYYGVYQIGMKDHSGTHPRSC